MQNDTLNIRFDFVVVLDAREIAFSVACGDLWWNMIDYFLGWRIDFVLLFFKFQLFRHFMECERDEISSLNIFDFIGH